MKSLKSIAQQHKFELNKLQSLVETMNDLLPVTMGSTKLYCGDDAKAIINKYYETHVNQAD